jgi:ADP-L-glycero-D-manno-heptose 6-epimerase
MHLSKVSSSLISTWQHQARTLKYVEVWEGAEKIKRDFVWVGDVCRLHVDFINSVKGSGLWNVGTGLAHSYYDVANEIAQIEGAELRITPVPAGTTLPRESVCADLTHLKETVGKRKWLNVYEWLQLT